MLLAIDPGNMQSAFVVIDEYKPIWFKKDDNDKLMANMHTNTLIPEICIHVDKQLLSVQSITIEMVESYGMAVGKEVFETVFWIGRFYEYCKQNNPIRISRKDIKLNLCGSIKAKDSNIRQALIDRFAIHDLKTGKGTKKNPDWFYGFHADIWAAYALGVTYLDQRR